MRLLYLIPLFLVSCASYKIPVDQIKLVHSADKAGTGLLIHYHDKNYLLTVEHLGDIEGYTSVAKMQDCDLALFSTLKEVTEVRMAEDFNYQDECTVVGYPACIGPTFTKGIVCFDCDMYTIISANAYAGSSGSPVFNKENELIGIVAAVYSSERGQYITFLTRMVPINIVRAFLDKYAN